MQLNSKTEIESYCSLYGLSTYIIGIDGFPLVLPVIDKTPQNFRDFFPRQS